MAVAIPTVSGETLPARELRRQGYQWKNLWMAENAAYLR